MFEGRVALVTGAGTGLGRAIAHALAGAGAAVAVNYARSRAEAERVVADLQAGGRRALAVQGDVADPDAVAAMVRVVEHTLGPADILVNNAGTTEFIPLQDLASVTVAHWERVLAVNLVGAFLCVQAVVSGMRARGSGGIVNVASTSAFTGSGSSIPYVVSKGALVTLTQTLARVLAPSIQVNAVAPGWMITPWLDRHLPVELAEGVRRDAAHAVPIEDVAGVVLSLLSNPSVTGQVVVVDRAASALGNR
jgi:3-oxoacyl-[acyl-carrier protein] reductase